MHLSFLLSIEKKQAFTYFLLKFQDINIDKIDYPLP